MWSIAVSNQTYYCAFSAFSVDDNTVSWEVQVRGSHQFHNNKPLSADDLTPVDSRQRETSLHKIAGIFYVISKDGRGRKGMCSYFTVPN